jgi:hypothetical protein
MCWSDFNCDWWHCLLGVSDADASRSKSISLSQKQDYILIGVWMLSADKTNIFESPSH